MTILRPRFYLKDLLGFLLLVAISAWCINNADAFKEDAWMMVSAALKCIAAVYACCGDSRQKPAAIAFLLVSVTTYGDFFGLQWLNDIADRFDVHPESQPRFPGPLMNILRAMVPIYLALLVSYVVRTITEGRLTSSPDCRT
jgi:hypothetical protein